MPSIKSGINSLGQATSKLSFIKVPRIGKPPRYDRWLKHLLATPHNKEAAGTCQKADVDLFLPRTSYPAFQERRRVTKISFRKSTVSSHTMRNIADPRYTNSLASQNVWRFAFPQRAAHTADALTEQVAKLRLPRLDAFATQTYRHFADQARQQKPDVPFTRDLMDEMFRRAVLALPKSALRAKGAKPEGMITRVSIVRARRSILTLIPSCSVLVKSPSNTGKFEKDPSGRE